ncbi:hypothetical protein A2963_03290 [Candidatus Roizmanbacteria bacterium RIFCSPLOWO2_01_FULL_40_13]|nr:MAG: hypothetical protein A2963_03290 [Candidatus Roizmanbacteria bacterium RIFCSPLOWO2_01_FULL_40_13]
MKNFLPIVNLFYQRFKRKVLIFVLIFSLFQTFFISPKYAYAQPPQDNSISIKTLVDLINLLFSGSFFPQGGNLPTLPPFPTNIHISGGPLPSIAYTPGPLPFTPPSGYKYYAQCGGSYDDIPLPNGCNLCKAGCGPTTVAMILASLVNSSIDPADVVNEYRNNNYYAGCDGSTLSNAKDALDNLGGPKGLKTTLYRSYNTAPIEQVASDFNNWIRSGWTIFALANYCENGCGHFFWIIEIDNNNNVWAYDPYYGRYEAPPINENRYYPFPKYRAAFGVKKL